LGKPGPDNKRGGTRKRDPNGGGGWDEEIFDWIVPIPIWPDPCKIAPWICGTEA